MPASTRGVPDASRVSRRRGLEKSIGLLTLRRAANYFRRAASDARRHGRARGERSAAPDARFVVVDSAVPFERGAGRRGVGLN